MEITAFIYMTDTELVSPKLYFSYWHSRAGALTENLHLHLEKYFCCHVNVTAEIKNSLIWLHTGTGQRLTVGFGWMAVKLQQLSNCMQERPGAKRVISFAVTDYFAQQPELNFHSSLCLEKFYFSDQTLIHRVIRSSHMVLSVHIWKEVSGLQEGHNLALQTVQTAPSWARFNTARGLAELFPECPSRLGFFKGKANTSHKVHNY